MIDIEIESWGITFEIEMTIEQKAEIDAFIEVLDKREENRMLDLLNCAPVIFVPNGEK